jgi:hypothetical protein
VRALSRLKVKTRNYLSIIAPKQTRIEKDIKDFAIGIFQYHFQLSTKYRNYFSQG